jgi:hypothetical protein
MFQQLDKICDVVDRTFSSGEIQAKSKIFLLKKEVGDMVYEIFMILREGLKNEVFDKHHIRFIKQNLLIYAQIRPDYVKFR